MLFPSADAQASSHALTRCSRTTRSAWWLTLLMAVAFEWVSGAARVQAADPYRIALLELESDDLQDSFAGDLSERVRSALSVRNGYQLRDAHVSLLQLSLAKNCNTAETSCLETIARELHVDGFVFGKVTHEGGAPVALLRRFDVRTHSVDRTALVSFTSRDVEMAERDRGARRLVDRLASSRPSASLAAVDSNAPAATTSSDGISTRQIAAYALLAGTVLSASMAVVSFVEVRDAAHDPSYNSYRLAVGDANPNVHDVCSEADAGRRYGSDPQSFQDVKSSCRLGKTFEVLQFVFIGGALLSGGLATYLLVDGASTERAQSAGLRFNVAPDLRRRSVSLSARLRF